MYTRRSARAEESEKTRSEILEVSLKLFAEKGYNQTSISDIVDAADTYRSAVDWHFGGKEGLLLSVIDYYLEQQFQKNFENSWSEYEKNNKGPWHEEAIKFYLTSISTLIQENLDIFMVLFTLTFEQLHKNNSLAEKIRGFWEKMTSILNDAIMQGKADGLFRKEIDPLWTAKSILALAQGLFMQWYIDPENLEIEKAINELAGSTLRLLYPESNS